jgi:hypothetical protein
MGFFYLYNSLTVGALAAAICIFLCVLCFVPGFSFGIISRGFAWLWSMIFIGRRFTTCFEDWSSVGSRVLGVSYFLWFTMGPGVNVFYRFIFVPIPFSGCLCSLPLCAKENLGYEEGVFLLRTQFRVNAASRDGEHTLFHASHSEGWSQDLRSRESSVEARQSGYPDPMSRLALGRRIYMCTEYMLLL